MAIKITRKNDLIALDIIAEGISKGQYDKEKHPKAIAREVLDRLAEILN